MMGRTSLDAEHDVRFIPESTDGGDDPSLLVRRSMDAEENRAVAEAPSSEYGNPTPFSASELCAASEENR